MSSSEGNFFTCVLTPFRVIWLALWPILAIVLGIVTGSIAGVAITLAVFGLTLVRTPMHIAKMLHVTATTDECFQGHLSFPMRITVLLWVPLVHLLFLVGITLFSGTVGLLFYIGKATKIFYNHEYAKTASKVKSNARLEPNSYFGKYYKRCQEFMSDDQDSHPTIYFLKACNAFILGLIVGTVPFLPFSVAVAMITLYRLPINFYKTIKITLFTVVLKWDLKILALLVLPLVHIAFPLVTFLGAIIASYVYATFRTTRNIYMGYSLFHKWGRFHEELKNYYKGHQLFVSERCETYDHPTGIPLGWNGTSYGIPIQRILKWQWDFLMTCIFAVYGGLFGFVGSAVLLALKGIPIFLYCVYKTIKSYCKSGCAMMLGTWPFYVVGVCLLPAGVVLLLILGVIVTTLVSMFRTAFTYLGYGYLAALVEPPHIITVLDGEWTQDISFGCSLLESYDENPYTTGVASWSTEQHRVSEATVQAGQPADSYWDRFEKQCIQTATHLIYEKQWISLEDVQTFDPSVVQSVPAVAILTVLVDSVLHEPPLRNDDFLWKVDGTVCKEEDRPVRDGITNHLLPMVLGIKKLLVANKKGLAQHPEDVDWLMALLCANSEDDTDSLKHYMEAASKRTNQGISKETISKIRTKINTVVLSILRVKPFQNRMSNIYDYDYSGEAAERGEEDGVRDAKIDGSIDSKHEESDGELGLLPVWLHPSRDEEGDEEEGQPPLSVQSSRDEEAGEETGQPPISVQTSADEETGQPQISVGSWVEEPHNAVANEDHSINHDHSNHDAEEDVDWPR